MDTVPIPEASIGQVNQRVSVGQEKAVPNSLELSQKKRSLKKFFNISTWVILFALLPVTVLIFLSQDTIPGDFFYPVKRGMENVVLAAASVSPVTKAAFRTDLTTRRFDEAEKLLLASSGSLASNGLNDFVTEIQVAQNEVFAISDPVKKQELQQKIQTSVIDYEKRLNAVKVKLVEEERVKIEPTITFLPTGEKSIPTNTLVPLLTSTPKSSMPSKSPTTMPTPSNPPSAKPTKAQVVLSPAEALTTNPLPPPATTSQPTPVPPVTSSGGTIAVVDDVSKYLHCLKNTPPPHRECVPPEIKSQNQSLENKSERPSEEKLKQEENTGENNEEKPSKRNESKKDNQEKEKHNASD